MVKVLFVCMGNICRSPTAEGVFRHLVTSQALHKQILIDSAGTHAYHIGEKPDPRAINSARQRGVDLSRLRARRVTAQDLEQYDYVLAMDRDNHQNLLAICPPGHEHKVRLFLEFAPDLDFDEVPDPYYGGISGFDRVLDMIEKASDGLLQELCTKVL